MLMNLLKFFIGGVLLAMMLPIFAFVFFFVSFWTVATTFAIFSFL